MFTTRTTRTRNARRFIAAVVATGALALSAPAVASAGGHGPDDKAGIPQDPCDLVLDCLPPDDGDEPDEPDVPCVLEHREDEPAQLEPLDEDCGRPERVPEDEPEDEPERNPDVVTAEPRFTG